MATTMNRTSQAFSSLSSIATSSSRVRTARTPVEAMPFRSPTMLLASRSTVVFLAAGGGETDDGAGGRGDADGAPRVAAHVFVGGGHGDLGAVGDGGLDLAEFLARDVVLAGQLGLHGVHLVAALVFHRLQKLLRFGDHVLDVTADGIGLDTAVHGFGSWMFG